MKFFIVFALFIASIYADDQQLFENESQKGMHDEDVHKHGMTLECDYAVMRHYWGEMYTCVVRNLRTSHHYDYIVNATGDHLTGKTDRDVEAVYVLGQRTPFIPYNITTPFGGSVRALRVEDSGLKFVNRTFRYEGPLEYIHLENNHIETVPKWAFRGLTELRWVSFRGNRITYLESGLFYDNKKLRRFSASNNRLEVIPTALFYDKLELEEIYFYNNRIRMVSKDLVKWATKLKVATFLGNPCTSISIYDGVNIATRLSDEFRTKCTVDCARAVEAKKHEVQDLMKELRTQTRCSEVIEEMSLNDEYDQRHNNQRTQSNLRNSMPRKNQQQNSDEY